MSINSFQRQYTYPPGVVLMWSGSATNLPEGFLFCDGSNGTPDMRNRFVLGTSSATASSVGSTRGSNSYTMSSSQLPSHNHSLNIESSGYHRHMLRRWNDRIYNWDTRETFRRTGSGWYSGTSGSHSHSVSTSTAGASSSIDNQPPYYTLAFIQKA